MASSPSPKLAFIIFFLSTLLLSHQIHAIDRHFFRKVARNHDLSPSPTNYHEASTLNNNNKEEVEEKEPTFVPQTTQTGYGHETGLNPPSLSSSSTYNHDDHMEKKNYASQLKGVDMYFSNQGAPSTEKQGISTTDKYNDYYQEEDQDAWYNGEDEKQKQGITTNNNYNYRQNQGAGYYGGVQKQGITTNNNYNYNYRQNQGAGYYGGVQKQGMSDTRFLEHGRYFHDINGENPKYIHYNGNNYNSNYEDFSNNNYRNPAQRYQNREEEQEAFDSEP